MGEAGAFRRNLSLEIRESDFWGSVSFIATPWSGVNFTNILHTAFIHADTKRAKKTVNSSSFLRFWDLRVQKLHVNTLMKSTPEGFEGSTTSVIWGSTFSSLSWRHSGFIPDLSVATSTSRAVNRFSNHVRPCSSFQICQRSGEIEKDRPRLVKSV